MVPPSAGAARTRSGLLTRNGRAAEGVSRQGTTHRRERKMTAEPAVWPTSLDEARQVQAQLRSQVVIEDRLGPVRLVAGVDAHEAPQAGLTWAAVALLRLSDLELQESVLACRPTTF